MSFFGAANLWELLGLTRTRRRPPAPPPAPPPPAAPAPAPAPPAPAECRGAAPAGEARRRRAGMQQRYDELVEQMKARYGLRVRKWRSSTSGCAWIVRYDDGREARLIEAPYPRGPMSCAVFLHEVGHHAIGFETYRPRCLEEYHAWRWALEAMRSHGISVTAAVERRVDQSIRWAVEKARRRGLRELPPELSAFR